jgi:hypothetical protein
VFTERDRKTLNRIEFYLNIVLEQGDYIMTKEAELLTAIQEETDAGMAVVMLLDKISGDLADLKATMDPDAAAKLDEAIGKIKANKEAWAAAVVRDTPAEGGAVDPHAAGM